MPDEDKLPAPKPADEPGPARELTRRERWLSGTVGVLAAAAGGASVFVSDNQAGSTTLLVFAAVFVLLAVQGTPLKRGGKDAFELERRLKPAEVAERAKEKLDNEGAAEAGAYLEGAREVDPSLAPVIHGVAS